MVTKIARFPFDKFSDASNQLGTQMKATGEVMSVGRTMEESLLKAVRSLETGVCHIYHKKFDDWTVDRMLSYIKEGTDDRLYAIAELIRRGVELALIYNSTKIDMFFLEKFKNIVEFEKVVAANPRDIETLRDAKRMGFSDKFIGQLWGMSQKEMFLLRREHNIFPVYKMIDTCASEFSSYVPYFYSTYEQENESIVSEREKIVVLGSGPIRIGQGVEFDYSTVHAIWSIRAAGYEAIIINNNPETVSTDYTTSDKLYFEPLTVEDVMNVITLEKPKGIVVSLGGQTAINLAEPLHELGVPIIGTGVEAIRNAEDRGCFEKIMEELGIPQPEAEAVTDIEAGVRAAERIGRCWCARATCWAAGPCRSFRTRSVCATISRRRSKSMRTALCWSIVILWAANWRWTPSVMARMSSFPVSWSTSRRRASTPATRSASIRPSA